MTASTMDQDCLSVLSSNGFFSAASLSASLSPSLIAFLNPFIDAPRSEPRFFSLLVPNIKIMTARTSNQCIGLPRPIKFSSFTNTAIGGMLFHQARINQNAWPTQPTHLAPTSLHATTSPMCETTGLLSHI